MAACGEMRQKLLDTLMAMMPGLLDEVAAKELAEEAIATALFKPTQIPNPKKGWSDPATIDGPSVLARVVADLVQPIITGAVVEWIHTHEEVVLGAIEKAIGDNVDYTIQRMLRGMFSHSFAVLDDQLRSAITDPATFMSTYTHNPYGSEFV